MKSSMRNLLLLFVLLGIVLATMHVRARAQAVTPRPEDLRYKALLIQPIATAEQRSVVAGTSVLLVQDRISGECFLAVTVGNSVGLSQASCGQ